MVFFQAVFDFFSFFFVRQTLTQLPHVDFLIVQVAVVNKDSFIAAPEDGVSGAVGVLERSHFAGG